MAQISILAFRNVDISTLLNPAFQEGGIVFQFKLSLFSGGDLECKSYKFNDIYVHLIYVQLSYLVILDPKGIPLVF